MLARHHLKYRCGPIAGRSPWLCAIAVVPFNLDILLLAPSLTPSSVVFPVVVLVTKSSLTLCDPMDCSPPGFSDLGILQARILKWVAVSFSRGSFQPRNQTCISCTGRQIPYRWANREAESYLLSLICQYCSLSYFLMHLSLPLKHQCRER